MANTIVSENSLSINLSLYHHDALFGCLSKADALVNIALSDHFLDAPRATRHDYLWTLSDVLVEARRLNECSMDLLLLSSKLAKEPCKNS